MKKKPATPKPDKWPDRCEARMPRRFAGGNRQGRPAHPGARCGLRKGHDGDHTLLQASADPWFGKP